MNTGCAELELPLFGPLAEHAGCTATIPPPLMARPAARSRRELLLALAGGDSRPIPPRLGPSRRRRRRSAGKRNTRAMSGVTH